MCGRIVARILKAAWTKDGKIVIPPAFRPSYNIAPTSGIVVFRAGIGPVRGDGQHLLDPVM
jgi:hypothetical protein